MIAANDIDERGAIVGQALVRETSQTSAFLAVPARCGHDDAATRSNVAGPLPPVLPEGVRRDLQREFRLDGPVPHRSSFPRPRTRRGIVVAVKRATIPVMSPAKCDDAAAGKNRHGEEQPFRPCRCSRLQTKSLS